jgi:ribosome-binding protein aMBF1 (putative translation factor)
VKFAVIAVIGELSGRKANGHGHHGRRTKLRMAVAADQFGHQLKMMVQQMDRRHTRWRQSSQKWRQQQKRRRRRRNREGWHLRRMAAPNWATLATAVGPFQ